MCLSDFMYVVLKEQITWEEMVNSQCSVLIFKVLSGKMLTCACVHGVMVFN